MSSEEEDMVCSKCNKKAEYSLVLACEHNLCVPCARKILITKQIKNSNLTQFIKCDLCNIWTELEPETIKQILEGGYENNEEDNESNNITCYVISGNGFSYER